MKTKNCQSCGAEMHPSVENYNYAECGLDYVTLQNVTVFRCPECGEHVLRIPAIEGLHRLIAFTVARKPSRLQAHEVKFLRKYLGLSNRDFAKTMGVTPEQSSRWTTTEPMGAPAERLLRVLVERLEPAREYPIEWLQNISEERGDSEPLVVRSDDAQWASVHQQPGAAA
ncbi:MAG TPA: type II TA system antitoxin MqsA family protein [Kofleriaceae bacterium]|nr:type II TA system antitoxin MqsA family protein [Kofleriaceae bacterium]